MPKPDIHPKWYPDAKVICNGEVVMTTGATQPEIHVDVWSGNHPFFTGTQKILDTEGRVDRFMRKYGMGSSDSVAAEGDKKEEKALTPEQLRILELEKLVEGFIKGDSKAKESDMEESVEIDKEKFAKFSEI